MVQVNASSVWKDRLVDDLRHRGLEFLGPGCTVVWLDHWVTLMEVAGWVALRKPSARISDRLFRKTYSQFWQEKNGRYVDEGTGYCVALSQHHSIGYCFVFYWFFVCVLLKGIAFLSIYCSIRPKQCHKFYLGKCQYHSISPCWFGFS